MQSFIRIWCKLKKIWWPKLDNFYNYSGPGQLLLPGMHFVAKIAWQVWDPISFHEFAMDSRKT